MLKVSDEFKKIVGLTEDFKPNFLEWDYRVYIDKKEYSSDIIKSLSISGQLQNNFTIGSSLSLSLELELLISEETYFPNSANITVYATLKNEAKIKGIIRPLNEDVLLGTFIATDIDRQTIGRIKIQACDIMGHIDYLSSEMSFTDLINPATKNVFQPEDFPIEARDLSIAIANRFNIQIEENIPEGNKLITNFIVLYGLTYRQALEYLAGVYGGYVKVNREGRLVFFRFTNTGIKLTKENYYNMTKGQYEFRAEAIQCTISKVEEHTNNDTTETFTNTSTLRIGDDKAKLNHTIVFTNPYISEAKMDDLLIMYRDVSYYPITMDAIGTCVLEPGDIITVLDHYDREYSLYIQSYKITCAAGIKETFESHYDYNGGSFSNSITGSIKQINEKLNSTSSFIENNFETITSGITRKEFTTTVNDLTTDIELSNNSMNKWIVEYYGGLREEDRYDVESILTRTPFRKELVPDSSSMVASRLYSEEIYSKVLCRFYTAVYVQEDVDDIPFKCSDSTIMYINGNKIESNKIESNTIKFNTGWNIIELYKGIEPLNQSDYIEVYFHVEVPRSEELYTHLTSDLMNEYAQPGENLNYISIMNPQSMNIDYTRIVSAERSMTTEAIIDRISETFVESDLYEQNISEVRQDIDSVTTTVSSLSETSAGHTEKLSKLESTADSISAEVKRVEEKADGNEERIGKIELDAEGFSTRIEEISGEIYSMDSEYEKKFSQIEMDVDTLEFSFGTSTGNNYFTNSSFMTDSPQSNYIYTTSKKGIFKYLYEDYKDSNIADTLSIATNVVDLDNEPATSFIVLGSDKENENSSVRSIQCDGFFSLSQTILEKDFFPSIDYKSTNQLYMSVNARLLEKSGIDNVYLNFFVIVETSNNTQFLYNSHEVLKVQEDPATMKYFALGDCMQEYSEVKSDTSTIFNVFPSNKSNSKDESGAFIYKNINPLGDDWEKQSVFINLKGVTESQNYTREDITKVSFGFNAFTTDTAPETGNNLSIALNEPFICITKGNVEHPYSQNPNEIFSGSTKINYDGIEVSKNTSPIKTKIRNTGMSIYNNDTQLAYFESDAYVPVLKVDKVISDGVATKDYKFSSTVQEIKVGVPDNDNLPEGEEPVIVDFTSLRAAFDSLPDFIDTDYLVIRVYGDVSVTKFTSLKNKKCGIIEILLEPGSNISGYPLLISNIDGVVRIRSTQLKDSIDIDFTKDTEDTKVKFGSIGFCLFCHNIRQLEISGINFSRKDIDKTESKLEEFDFPFNYIYQYRYGTGSKGSLTELVDILKYSAIFIGYCNLVDINRCNFGLMSVINDYDNEGTVPIFNYGIVGDHSDCYLFNNKGTLIKHYYVNRDKCWYRLPVKGSLGSEWDNQVYEPSIIPDPDNPDSTPSAGGIGNVIDGNTGNEIEQSTGTNTSGTGAGKQEGAGNYNPPYEPSIDVEDISPNDYYAAFKFDNRSFNNYSSMYDMYVGPLSYSKTNGGYREKDGNYYPDGATYQYICDQDKYGHGYKHYGCEFMINAPYIADILNGRYADDHDSSIILHLEISRTSYAPSQYASDTLKFYVKLLLNKDDTVTGEDGGQAFKALHYTPYTIELDKNGISAYAWDMIGSNASGIFDKKTSTSPFTVSPTGSDPYTIDIRLDNKTFSSNWIQDIENNYDIVSKTIGFDANDYLDPDIFTNIKEAFKQGKVLAVQLHPNSYKGQCFKVEECYITVDYLK